MNQKPAQTNLNLTSYGCLPCYHSRVPNTSKVRCVLGFDSSKGRACGQFDAANGRQV